MLNTSNIFLILVLVTLTFSLVTPCAITNFTQPVVSIWLLFPLKKFQCADGPNTCVTDVQTAYDVSQVVVVVGSGDDNDKEEDFRVEERKRVKCSEEIDTI